MPNARHIAVDLMRALGVLALVFLSFVHPAAVAAPVGHDILTVAVDQSFCGGAPDSDTGKAHAPCHACRVDAAILPPPAGGLLDAPAVLRLVIDREGASPALALVHGLPEARGPPRLA